MKKILISLALFFTSINLVGCSMNYFSQASNQTPAAQPMSSQKTETTPEGSSTDAVGGSIAGAMNETDKNKLSRALDSAPGKSTHWISEETGTSYTVTPIKKVTIGENNLCRTYEITAERDSKTRTSSGTACINASGTWGEV